MKWRVLLLLVVLSVPGSGFAADKMWVPVSADTSSTTYYGLDTIQCSSEGLVRVWTMSVYNDKGVLEKVEFPATTNGELKSWTTDMRVNCKNKRFKVGDFIAYSKNDTVIYKGSDDDAEWIAAVPKSNSAFLVEEVCNFCYQ